MDQQWEIDLGKIIILTVALVGVTILGLTNTLDDDAVVSFYTFILGYIVGNGINAIRKVPSKGIIHKAEKEEEEDV